MARISIRSIVEDLFQNQPEFMGASDDEYLEVVRKAALSKGYQLNKIPEAWNLLRTRFAVKAEITGKGKSKIPKAAIGLVEKARLSALEAVAAYNNPMSPFRSGSFIVHMHIAWNALLLAVFLKRDIKPYYFDSETKKPEIIDGDYKTWDLSKCAKEYWKGGEYAAYKNLEFFVGLRNKIEHSLMPELDLDIFGECQALLVNFENTITREFGDKYALIETLSMSLQFSRLRDQNQTNAVRKLHQSLTPEIKKYIDKFRSGLSDDIFSDMEYSFKVFLIPNVGNHRSKDSLAVEFVNYDTLEPEDADKYKRLVTLIRDRKVPVANLDMMRAGEVARRVAAAIKPRKFTASAHHVRCWKHYGVRPLKGSKNPIDCKTKYCCYDDAHQDYVYTPAWVEFLIKELSDPDKYDQIMSK